jgi:hypothetical protein
MKNKKAELDTFTKVLIAAGVASAALLIGVTLFWPKDPPPIFSLSQDDDPIALDDDQPKTGKSVNKQPARPARTVDKNPNGVKPVTKPPAQPAKPKPTPPKPTSSTPIPTLPNGMYVPGTVELTVTKANTIETAASLKFFDGIPGQMVFAAYGYLEKGISGMLIKPAGQKIKREVWPDLQLLDKPLFSSDGKHYAYTVQTRGAREDQVIVSAVVNDGAIGPKYSYVGAMTLSQDGKHTAYRAMDKGKSMVIVDGKIVHSTDIADPKFNYRPARVPLIYFSPDGLHYAFAAEDGFFVDNKKVNKFATGAHVAWSPDSKSFAYFLIRTLEGKYQTYITDVFVNRKHKGRFRRAIDYVWSADSKTFAFAAMPMRSSIITARPAITIYANGVVSPTGFQQIVPGTMQITPNGKRIAYIAEMPNQTRRAVDGTTVHKPWSRISPETFGFDDKNRLSYRAQIDGIYESDGAFAQIIDGVRTHDMADGPYMPSGKHTVFIKVSRPDKYINRFPQQSFQTRSERHAFIVDGQKWGSFRAPGVPYAISPDGKHIAYAGVEKHRGPYRLFIDKIPFDIVPRVFAMEFTSPTRLVLKVQESGKNSTDPAKIYDMVVDLRATQNAAQTAAATVQRMPK